MKLETGLLGNGGPALSSRAIKTAREPAWLVPRTVEDLWSYDEMIKCSTEMTFSLFGRPPDYGTVKAISFVAWTHLVSKDEPEALARASTPWPLHSGPIPELPRQPA